MSEKNSRRHFLRLLGASSGALLLGNIGCGGGLANNAEENAEGGATSPAPTSCDLTGSDVRGPFHLDGAPQRTRLASPDEPGESLVIAGTVYGPDCETPVAGALLDIWHADTEGDYHNADADWRLRGQVMTDQEGRYSFETILPGHYPLGASMRPAHIHFTITNPGYEPLTTQLYFKGDPYLAPNDPCGRNCNSGDPTLIIELEEAQEAGEPLRGTFDIVLSRS